MQGIEVPIEKLYDRTHSMYKLVVLASKRTLELNEGATPLTDKKSDNIALEALNEIAEDKVSFKEAKPDKK